MNEMSDDLQALKQALADGLSVTDARDGQVLQVALLSTVYFAEPWRREVREAVAMCCEDYIERWSPHLRWALSPRTRRMERFGQGEGSRPMSWVPARAEDASFSVIVHGGESAHGACAIEVRALGAARQPFEQLGYLRVARPLLAPLGMEEAWPEALLAICRRVKPVSGYGGIGVIQSPNNGISHRYEPIVYELAQRFPGLEVDFPIDHAIWLCKGRDKRGGIKGVNWLTVIGERWLAELGGAAAVQAGLAVLDPRFVVQGYEGGVMIQAGAQPELGDSRHNAWPGLYVKLAQYLKPIRISEHRPFGHAGPGERFGNRSEDAEAWLRRFDTRP